MVHLIHPSELDRILDQPTPDHRFQVQRRVLDGTTWFRADDAFGSPGIWHRTQEAAEVDRLAMMRDRRTTCRACDGSGIREHKHPVPGWTYCTCPKGRAERARVRARNQRERQAERRADLPW